MYLILVPDSFLPLNESNTEIGYILHMVNDADSCVELIFP